MGTVHKIVNDRTVIDRKEGQDISQEPEMQELVEINHEMTEGEKTRTVEYLKDQDGNKTNCKEDLRMELLTPKEASEILKVSIHSLAKWRCQGQGPDYVKTGKSVKYSLDTVGEWITNKTIKTKQGG
jgi:hypothetical protein